MRHFVYQTIQRSTGRYYIGVHSAPDLEDRYLGGGRDLRKAIRECGRADFHRHVVKTFRTRKAAERHESALVTRAVVEDPRSFNLKIGGKAGGAPGSATRARQSAAAQGRDFTPEQRAASADAIRAAWQDPEKRARMIAKRADRPVEIDGKIFDNAQAAALHYRRSRATIWRWIKTGMHGARKLPRGNAPDGAQPAQCAIT